VLAGHEKHALLHYRENRQPRTILPATRRGETSRGGRHDSVLIAQDSGRSCVPLP
jgi:hypothetical protein